MSASSQWLSERVHGPSWDASPQHARMPPGQHVACRNWRPGGWIPHTQHTYAWLLLEQRAHPSRQVAASMAAGPVRAQHASVGPSVLTGRSSSAHGHLSKMKPLAAHILLCTQLAHSEGGVHETGVGKACNTGGPTRGYHTCMRPQMHVWAVMPTTCREPPGSACLNSSTSHPICCVRAPCTAKRKSTNHSNHCLLAGCLHAAPSPAATQHRTGSGPKLPVWNHAATDMGQRRNSAP